MTNDGRGADLLLFLHALVMRDRGPPGMNGSVSFGVRIDDHDTWWVARFGSTADAKFQDTAPQADVSLLLGDREAFALLQQGKLPRKAELRGDRKLLDRFLARYVAQQSAIDVRSVRR